MTLLLVASFWFLFSLAAGWFLGKCMSLLGRDLPPSTEDTGRVVPPPGRPAGASSPVHSVAGPVPVTVTFNSFGATPEMAPFDHELAEVIYLNVERERLNPRGAA